MSELALNNLVTEIKFFENQAVVSYWEIGKRLAQAKEQVGHGEWENWLKENLNYSQSTANKLVKVYSSFSKSELIPNLSFTQAIALTSVDEETRTEIIKNEQLEDKTVKETQEIIKRYKVEKAELEEENQGLKKANEELSRIAEKAPEVIEKEVIKEVKPSDYESLRLKAKELDKAYEEINRKDIQIKSLKLKEQEQLRKLNEIDGKGKIIDDLKMFMWKIDGFINDVGGLIYLTDYYDELPKKQKSYFEKSVQRISDWSNQLKYNLQNKKEM